MKELRSRNIVDVAFHSADHPPMDIKRALQAKQQDERIDGLFAIERELRALLDRRMQRSGLTYAQYSLLRFIAGAQASDLGPTSRPVQPGDIARYYGFAPRTVTVSVKALVDKKLVQRKRSSIDGRAQELTLSTKGREVLLEATKAHNKTKEIFGTLPRLHWNQLWDIIPNVLFEIANQNRKDSLKKVRG